MGLQILSDAVDQAVSMAQNVQFASPETKQEVTTILCDARNKLQKAIDALIADGSIGVSYGRPK